MKITRMKRGYRITLSDGEFDALQLLVNEGRGAYEADDIGFSKPLSPAGKRAMHQTFAPHAWCALHADRRREG